MVGKYMVLSLTILAGVAPPSIHMAAQSDTSELTGRELYDLCARDDDFCVGFIAGAVSTTRAWALSGGLTTMPFCLPDGTTYEQLARTYLAWAEQNPGQLDEIATVVIHEAMAAVAPC
jgi:hypothetical protein